MIQPPPHHAIPPLFRFNLAISLLAFGVLALGSAGVRAQEATAPSTAPAAAPAPAAVPAVDPAAAVAAAQAWEPTEEQIARGRQVFVFCSACHGADGHGNAAIKVPAIAGQTPWYVVTQLTNFRQNIRGAHPDDTHGMMMRPMARTLKDDEDVKAVAAYIASLTPKPRTTTVEGGDATKGQTYYAACMACHGDKGQGNPLLKSPALAHLEDWYIMAQLDKLKKGIRGNDVRDIGAMTMRPILPLLPDQQAVKDVIAYISQISDAK